MKRAPLYSGPRRNRTGSVPAVQDPAGQPATSNASSPSQASNSPQSPQSPRSPQSWRAPPAPSARAPASGVAGARTPAGRTRDDRAAVWGGPPKRYPGQPTRRWPEQGRGDPAGPGLDGLVAGRGQDGHQDRRDPGVDAASSAASPAARWRGRLARAAWPVAGACAGLAVTLGYFLIAPAGWPGSTADRGVVLTQEQIDEAVGQSLQTLTLPSMAARAAAVVAPSVVRVRSYGPAEAPATTEGESERTDRTAPGAPRDGSPGQPPRAQASPPAGQATPQGNQPMPPGSQPALPGSQVAPPAGPGGPGLPGAQGGQPEGQTGPPRQAQREGAGEPRLDKGERIDRAESPAEPAGRGDRAGAGAGGKGGGRDADVQNGVGTGVVIKDDGLILSNLHVVAGARRITVVFADGTESPATLTGARPEHDLAVLKASKVPDDLQPAVLRSTGDLSEGDGVVVVGFPFDIGPSVSSGVISGFNREYQSASGARVLSNLIQFDAAANPGNSGGPLATMEGEVVGIVTAILNPNNQRSFVGIGFAVPIENAMAAAGLPPH